MYEKASMRLTFERQGITSEIDNNFSHFDREKISCDRGWVAIKVSAYKNLSLAERRTDHRSRSYFTCSDLSMPHKNIE